MHFTLKQLRYYKQMRLNNQILIIDDSQVMRRIIRGFLQRMGFTTIIEASNGKDALGIIAGQKLDLVISDWSMQGITGFDILVSLRQDKKTKDIPFVMITAEAQLFHIIKAFRARVSQYLVKPFSFQQFEYILRKIDEIF